MSNDTKKVVVSLIKNNEGKFLFIRPVENDFYGEYHDAWYPPAGHVEVGETEENALVRELKEELNLEVKPIKLISEFEQDVIGETAYWWECQIVSGDYYKNSEIEEFGWFTVEEIRNLKLWPATNKFFEKFIWKKY